MIVAISGYELAKAVGWTMIHSGWEGVMMAILVIGFSYRRSSEHRYVVQCFGLAGMLALALGTFAIQLRMRSIGAGSFGAVQTVKASEQVGTVYKIFTRGDATASAGFNWDGVATVLACVWMVGFIIMSVRAGVAAWRVRSLRQRAIEWADESWRRKLRDWTKEFGISKPVRLCLTAMNDVPAVIGHFKPIVLLPGALVTHLSTAQLEALILHELTHIRRNDYLINFLQLLCETVLFFHPLAWWLSAHIREEREHCCDARVASRDANPLPYAKALLALEKLRVNSAGTLAIGAGGSSLKRRIKCLLAPPPTSPRIGSWTMSVCSIAAIAMIGFNFWPKAVAQPVPTPERSLFQIRMVVTEGGEELPLIRRNAPGKLRVAKQVILNETHVKTAEVIKDQSTGDPQISIRLNNEGAERFAKATRANVGKQAAIIINQQIISAPRINEPITGGMLVINGNFSEQEASDLARKLSPESGKTEKKQSAIKLQSFFIEMPGDPAEQFTLGTRLDSASADVSAWDLTVGQAREIIAQAQKVAENKVLSAPTITTLSGKAARVQMGDVADQDGVFSLSAKGFVTNDPVNQEEFAVVGQSVELLPELGRDHLIIAGKFLNREKVPMKNGRSLVQTSHSAPFYLNVPRSDSFALEQKSKTDPAKYLLLVVISEILE
jgi:beta-lactamase regulating signal transducer with metallopeptidase domain